MLRPAAHIGIVWLVMEIGGCFVVQTSDGHFNCIIKGEAKFCPKIKLRRDWQKKKKLIPVYVSSQFTLFP